MALIDTSTWRHEYVAPVDQWIVAVDLGQSIDPTAIAALHHTVVGTGKMIEDEKRKIVRQGRRERFDVRHLERLPLGMDYVQQVQHVVNMLSREPLEGATLVIDRTGVGRPVGDLFEKAGLFPIKVTITAGASAPTISGRDHNVPKGFIVSAMESRLHTGDLRFAAELTEAPALRDELQNFGRSVSAAGRVTFNARSGKHDDIVMAVGIAVYVAINRPFVKIEPFPAM